MNRHLRVTLIVIVSLCFMHLLGCVSVKLPSSESHKAEGVKYNKPSSDFSRFYPQHLDAAWKNSKNGNSISYYSECGAEKKASYENIQKGLLRSISSAKIQRELNVQISNETGLRSIVSGQVDGKTSLVDLIIFHKGDCTYILTYVGSSTSFLDNKDDFERFYKNFRAAE